MNRFKTTFNGKTLCVFACVDSDIIVHIANIDTMVKRLYTTTAGYDLLATNSFKTNHRLMAFDEVIIEDTEYNEADDFKSHKSKNSEIHKFDACVDFSNWELQGIINMCSREFSFQGGKVDVYL